MRVIFAGTPEFAASALAALIQAGHEIPLVLTQPDRPAGRGMQLQPSPVKQLAIKHGITVLQPTSLKQDAQAREIIDDIKADVMIVAAYGLILPQAVLDMPRLGCLNIHASLLPRWRGAAPIHRAILAGDSETGICIMQMEAGLDTGPVLAQGRTTITATDTTGSLHDRLAEMGGTLIVETLAALPLSAKPQSATGITYATKIEKSEALLDWQLSAQELDRHIRAFNPFPAAQTSLQGATIKIWSAHPVIGEGRPGTVLSASRQGIHVACGSGALCITELQKAGSKRLAVADFLAGHSIKPNETFGEQT